MSPRAVVLPEDSSTANITCRNSSSRTGAATGSGPHRQSQLSTAIENGSNTAAKIGMLGDRGTARSAHHPAGHPGQSSRQASRNPRLLRRKMPTSHLSRASSLWYTDRPDTHVAHCHCPQDCPRTWRLAWRAMMDHANAKCPPPPRLGRLHLPLCSHSTTRPQHLHAVRENTHDTATQHAVL